jgi:hypothetical protein
MKISFVMALLSALGAGCATPASGFLPATAKESAARGVDSRPIYKPPVVAGQINGENAKEKAQALNEELDRDLSDKPEVSADKR